MVVVMVMVVAMVVLPVLLVVVMVADVIEVVVEMLGALVVLELRRELVAMVEFPCPAPNVNREPGGRRILITSQRLYME